MPHHLASKFVLLASLASLASLAPLAPLASLALLALHMQGSHAEQDEDTA
jgi:hypothetical protein